MGGTFMSMPEDYRGKFIAQLHNALSGFTGTDVDEAVRYASIFFWLQYAIGISEYRFIDIRSKASQKPLVSLSKRGQITV
jgi:hypothetical protein